LIESDTPTPLLDKLSKILQSGFIFDQFNLTYQLVGFVKNKTYYIRLEMTFNMGKYEFDIQYDLRDQNQYHFEQALITGGYDRIFTEKQIETLVIEISGGVYRLLEKQVKAIPGNLSS
jgi:hypothetical protein